ncbi:MAG: CPBP family intramembrane metalloprotease [Calditrichaceae bacterium]|nr:CPBP family intramembrane metalloprotease [Calditrichaceae bacterium]MBN2709239.1 CPBP family intramembrane metalloprotease [Calditrichaceae bacterium]RQV96192.1 MAG: CPBP family intramembrane metalloprotease [Calditrichota bacterium]
MNNKIQQDNNHKKYPEPLEALMLIAAIVFGIFILVLSYTLVFGDMEQPEMTMNQARYIYIFAGSLFFIIPYFYGRSRQYEVKELFRLNPVPYETLIISVLFGLSLSVLGDELDRLIALIIPVPDWLKEQLKPLEATNFIEWTLVILGAVIVASVSEEGLFRGFFQVTLEKKGDVTRAVTLSAITWTLVHANPYWAIQIFVTGVFIGFLSWRTNSIYPPIIVHALNNIIALLYLNAATETPIEWYEWHGHVSPLILLPAAAILYWSVRQLNIIHRR